MRLLSTVRTCKYEDAECYVNLILLHKLDRLREGKVLNDIRKLR